MLLRVVRPLPLLPFLVCCRGILLYGPPGTGKTLLARAVAGECARISPRPVTLFARKGADCLGKYAGDAERTLRLIFEEVSHRPRCRKYQAAFAHRVLTQPLPWLIGDRRCLIVPAGPPPRPLHCLLRRAGCAGALPQCARGHR